MIDGNALGSKTRTRVRLENVGPARRGGSLRQLLLEQLVDGHPAALRLALQQVCGDDRVERPTAQLVLLQLQASVKPWIHFTRPRVEVANANLDAADSGDHRIGDGRLPRRHAPDRNEQREQRGQATDHG